MIGEKAAHHRGVCFDPPLGRKAIAKRTRTSQVEVAEGLAGQAWVADKNGWIRAVK
jgi:hypothetical protein